MAGRSIEVRKIDGLQELLDSSLYYQAPPRIPPDRDEYERSVGAARQMLTAALNLIDDGKTVVFSVAKWPADGAARYGILVALNPRFKTDPFTDKPYFAREFTDGEDDSGRLVTWTEADEDLVSYATAQFGKPKLIK